MDRIATVEVVMQAAGIVVIITVEAMDMEVAEAVVGDIIVTLVVAIVEVNILFVLFTFCVFLFFFFLLNVALFCYIYLEILFYTILNS